MGLIQQIGDMSVFTLGGTNVLAVFEDVSYVVNETQVDGSSVTRPGATPQGTKLSAKLSTKLMSTISAPDRVSHLDLSSATIGGSEKLGLVRSLNFSGSFVQRPQAGVGGKWKRPQNTQKDYRATIELDCDADVASAFMADMHSATYANRDKVLSFVLNGVTITLPTRMESVDWSGGRADLQTIKIGLSGKCPDVGAYPTAPTLSATLLEKAFNAWQAALTIAFTSKAADGFTIGGDVIFSSFTVDIQDEQIVSTQYAFDSYGTMTASAT